MSKLKTAVFDKGVTVNDGEYVEIFINPTPQDIKKVNKLDRVIRGVILDNGEVYIWDGVNSYNGMSNYINIDEFRFALDSIEGWTFNGHGKYTVEELKKMIIKYEDKLSSIGNLNLPFTLQGSDDTIYTTLNEIKKSMEGMKMNRLKTAKIKDLGKINKVDIDELKKIWGGFKFKYNDISYQFSKIFTEDGPDYEVKVDGKTEVLKEFDEAIKYLEKNIKENKKVEGKINRLKTANHVSPMMHEEVYQHIISEPSGLRTKEQQSSMSFVIAKELIAALPLVPANEILYNLVQDIEAGYYEDISPVDEAMKNWDAWKQRAKDLLIAKGILVKTSRLRKIAEGEIQKFNNTYTLAKELIAAIPLVPDNEMVYELDNYIQMGLFNDVSTPEQAHNHWDAWIAKTKEILIDKNFLVKSLRDINTNDK